MPNSAHIEYGTLVVKGHSYFVACGSQYYIEWLILEANRNVHHAASVASPKRTDEMTKTGNECFLRNGLLGIRGMAKFLQPNQHGKCFF